MEHSSIANIRAARQWFRSWLDSVQDFPDPAYQLPSAMHSIAGRLRSGEEALRQAPPNLIASQLWRDEVAAYVETLRELRARLGNFEITLQIRKAQVSNARACLSAVRSWSDLAKQIG